jgi:tRNA(Ile)-lysidine synthase
MVAPAQRVGVAVSGGADSVCLLHILLELAPRWNWRLTVLHLDHQLRGAESRADAAFVGELAARLGLPIVTRCASLAADGNLEEEARRARLVFFQEAIGSGTVERIALGHTRSDQAETVLFRLLRGSGSAGLAGIRPVTSDGVVRPLLDVDRAEVEDYLRAKSIEWREDSTNSSRRFARNRLRHDLLPQLAREWNPEIGAILARTADWALAEESYWESEISRLETGAMVQQGGAVLLRVAALGQLPLAAARRLVRRAMEKAKGDLRGIDFQHVDDVLLLAGRTAATGLVQAHGLEIRRSFDWLRFVKFGKDRDTKGFRVPAPVPASLPVPPAGRAICLELIEKSEILPSFDCVYNGEMGCVDWDRLSGSLELRNWMPGDRYQPVGSASVKKIKTLFQVARIPLWERRHWPVLVDGASIVWTRQFGAAIGLAAGPGTRTVLLVRETEAA